MSTVFEVPCPDCGQQMSVAAGGELQCPTCERTYHARMGHLFPVSEQGTQVVMSESPPGRGPARRPTVSTS
jgi:tRNA(Ile2) C34 agmatinyltransferase TiaS